MKTQVNNPFQRWQLSPRHQDPRTRGRRARRAREEGHKFRTNLFEFRRHLCEVPVPLSPARNTSGCPQPLRGPSLLLWQPPEPPPWAKLTPFVPGPAPSAPQSPSAASLRTEPIQGEAPLRREDRHGRGSGRGRVRVPLTWLCRRCPAPGGSVRGAALTGSRSRSGLGRPRPARRGSGRGAGQGRGSGRGAGQGPGSGQSCREQPQAWPAPPRGPSGCRGLHRAAARPEPRGFPRFPARPPRIAPDGLQRQRGKPPVRSVSPSGNLPAPAAQSPSHSACPESAAASGITGRSARKHKKGNLLACLLFALHLEINGIPNVATPENDDLPSPSPPFCILHRCGEA